MAKNNTHVALRDAISGCAAQQQVTLEQLIGRLSSPSCHVTPHLRASKQLLLNGKDVTGMRLEALSPLRAQLQAVGCYCGAALQWYPGGCSQNHHLRCPCCFVSGGSLPDLHGTGCKRAAAAMMAATPQAAADRHALALRLPHCMAGGRLSASKIHFQSLSWKYGVFVL